jgi:hypothetical protein
MTGSSVLDLILPNCDAGDTPPCPQQGVVDGDTASLFTGVSCTESGCNTALSTGLVTLASFEFTAAAVGATTINLVDHQENALSHTQLAAVGNTGDIVGTVSDTNITIQSCSLPYDFDADARVTVADIMSLASRWLAGIGDSTYNGQADINGDGTINIIDIQTAANSWDTTCTP